MFSRKVITKLNTTMQVIINAISFFVSIFKENDFLVPTVKDRLRGKEVPQAILNLQETVTKTEDFIETYGEKSFFKKFTGWHGIKEKFENLNQEITQVKLNIHIFSHVSGCG